MAPIQCRGHFYGRPGPCERPNRCLDGIGRQPGNAGENEKNPYCGQLPEDHQQRDDQCPAIGQEVTQCVGVKEHSWSPGQYRGSGAGGAGTGWCVSARSWR